MNLRMFGGFVFLCVLISMALGTPRDEASDGGDHSTEHGYQSLLKALQDLVNDHKHSAKTSNAGNSRHAPRGTRNTDISQHCLDILNQGHKKSGIYSIQPTGLPAIKVVCNMATRGGGWTVIQTRRDGSVDFYRDWLEYVAGFGDVYGEYWLGLHNIHILTHNTPMELFVSVEDFENNTRFAHYDFFAIGSELDKFDLSIGSYFGNAGDSLEYHRGGKFGTKDQDNDAHKGACGEICKGAWWYKSCYHSNLNGQYLKGQQDVYGMAWSKWKGSTYSMKTSLMMIRPKY